MARKDVRGFALLIVLWTMGLLALLGTRLTATSRVQLRLAAEARDQAIAEAAADAGINQAVFTLIGAGQIAGRAIHIQVGEARVDIVAEDQAEKINPNTAPRDVLRGLLVAIGVDQPAAARLSGEISDWRTRGEASVLGGQKIDPYLDRRLPYRSGDHSFYSVDELGLVADMTPEILERLRPWLSVYHEGDVSDAGVASPVAAAVGDAKVASRGAPAMGFVSRNVILRVTATATVAGRARFVRSAVVRLRDGFSGPVSGVSDLVQVLTWE